MKLIICEKPDLARKVVSAVRHLDALDYKDGYYRGEEYSVTNAFGHLFGLYDIEDYTGEEGGTWNLDVLPYCPDTFRFCLLKDHKTKKTEEGVRKQFDLICRLMNSDEVDEIVHGGDSDREGECIIRLIIQAGLKSKKRITRLWLPDQTEDTILDALQNLPLDSTYNNLANEGMARMYIDWLVGINLSRYLSIKAGGLCRAGRVILAILHEIYLREKEIEHFVPVKYYGVESNTLIKKLKIRLSGNEKFAKDDLQGAIQCCDTLNAAGGRVTKVERKRIMKQPGKLFSLTTLQSTLAKREHMKPDEVLSNLQKVYEAGYVTYPRTNTEYLGEAEKDKISNIIEVLKKDRKYDIELKDSKKIFDDSKIESHSALTPTHRLPDREKLSKGERIVYETILNRFLAVFCAEKCEVDKTVIEITVKDDVYKLSGEVMMVLGFNKYEPKKIKENELPDVKERDSIAVDFKPVERQTAAPKRYTVETLNNFMENPFGRDKKDDTEAYKRMFEGVDIGTVGTRAGIIKNAQDNGYISLKDNNYYLEDNGRYVMKLLDQLGIDMTKEKTVEMSKNLKQVYKGTLSITDAVGLQQKELNQMFLKRDAEVEKMAHPDKKEIGKCPKCGGNVVPGTKSYYCANYKDGCKFAIWRSNKYFDALNVKVTDTLVESLLKNKKALVRLTSKENKKYSAYVIADFSDEYPQYHIEFKQKGKRKKGA